MKKLCTLLLTVCMLLVLLAGCSSGSSSTAQPASDSEAPPAAGQTAGEKTTIVFATAADDSWQKTLNFALENANQALAEKNIEITVEYYPSEDDMWKVLPAQIVSGAAPDIVGLNNEGILEFITNGTFAALDDLIVDSGFDTSLLDKTNLDGWKYEGKQYGLPFTTTITALAVNMTMLKEHNIDKAPETMEEMLVAAQACNDPDNGVYGICVPIHEFHLSQYTHAYEGGWNFGKDLENDGNKQGLQFVVDLYNTYHVAATPAQLGVNGEADAFGAGKCAMVTGGPWFVPVLRDMDVDFEWKMVPMPSGTAQHSTLYGWAFCMLESSKNKAAAMDAIAAILSEESYQYLAEVRGDIPAMSKYVSTYEELYPEMAVVLDTSDNAMPFDYPVAANRFKSDLVTGMENVIFQNSMTVEDLLADMAADGYEK